jgi:DNA-binding beta-propeller fold protein YncE
MRTMTFNRVIIVAIIASLAKWADCENNPETSVAPPGRIFELLGLNRDIGTTAWPKYRSPCDIKASPDKKFLYVAEQTAKRLSVVSFESKALLKTITLPNEPTGIAVAPDGNLLYVTCSSDRWPDGMVCEVSPGNGKVLRHIPAGQGARSPVISHNGKTLYVCNQHGDNISVLDIASGTLVTTMGAMREPYAAALTPDDSVLVVTNCLPVQKATDTLSIASKILLYDVKANKLMDTIPLPTGSHSVFGITITPDGKYAIATHLIGMFAIPATKIEGGWIHTNNIAIVDIKKRKILNDASLDLPTSGVANPWGIDCSPDGKILCVAHSGSNQMSVVDLQQLITVADTSDYSPGLVVAVGAPTTLSHDLTRIAGITDRVKVSGKAPRALTVVGNQVITAGYFDDYLEVFDLVLPNGGITKTSLSTKIDLGPEVPKTTVRMGEFAFFDASNCLQKWQSCQSCHPLTRTDGLNWTLNAPLAAPKNAKSMLYSWWTAPTSWAGRRQNAYESIRAGVRSELFLEPDDAVASAMDTFFMTLKPVPSPHLKKGQLTEAAKHGRTIFFTDANLDCKKCHPAPLYTDFKTYDSGIFDKYDANRYWDTPSMIEAWRGAPYDHLGSMDQITDLMKDKGHSNAGALPAQDFADLVEFILSL